MNIKTNTNKISNRTISSPGKIDNESLKEYNDLVSYRKTKKVNRIRNNKYGR